MYSYSQFRAVNLGKGWIIHTSTCRDVRKVDENLKICNDRDHHIFRYSNDRKFHRVEVYQDNL